MASAGNHHCRQGLAARVRLKLLTGKNVYTCMQKMMINSTDPALHMLCKPAGQLTVHVLLNMTPKPHMKCTAGPSKQPWNMQTANSTRVNVTAERISTTTCI